MLFVLGLSSFRTPVSQAELFLVFFSLSYFGFDVYHNGAGLRTVVLELLGPWMAYALGKLCVWKSGNRFVFLEMLAVLSLGMCLHGFLNWYAYRQGNLSAGYAYQRIAVDFWRGEVVSVTCTGMLFSLAASGSIGILFAGRLWWARCLAFVCLAASLFVSAYFANRTLWVICMLVLLFQSTVWFTDAQVPLQKKIMAAGAVLFCVWLLAVLFTLDFWEFRTRFFSLKLVERVTNREPGLTRIQIWREFFRNGAWVLHPWGGRRITEGRPFSWFHNLWLDTYNDVGFLPCLLLLLFTGREILEVLQFGRRMRETDRRIFGAVAQCTLLGAFLNCMVEPVWDANPYFFLAVLICLGAVRGQMLRETQEVKFP